MTSNVHRWLMFLGSLGTGAGAITGAADIIDPQMGSWIAFAGAAAIFLANTMRVYFPDKGAVDLSGKP
jgi:hypothetical protein